MPTPANVRQQITERIIAALENSVVPWRRPWSISRNAGAATNIVSRRSYSGINPLLLQLHSLDHGFRSKWWATFEQIKALGGMVRRRPAHVPAGQWGCRIIFMKQVVKSVTDADSELERQERFSVMRTYTVFNIDQTEGEALDRFRVDTETDAEVHPDYAAAEQLIEASGADIRKGGNVACYHRPHPEGSWPHHTMGDFIEMPSSRQFSNQANYWETLLHEMAHFAECRLGWDHKDRGYAAGELVAELTACNLASELAIPQGEDFSNHVAYLQSWLAAMKADPSFIFRAASQASKVTDFLLSFVPAHIEVCEQVAQEPSAIN
jgi:antirestriction protein ArdC